MARRKANAVNWKALEEEILAYRAAFASDRMGERLFRTSLDGEGWNPKPFLDLQLPIIEKAILEGRTEDALRETGFFAVELCARVEAMAKAILAAKQALSTDASKRELLRRDGQHANTIGRKLDADRKAQTCRALFAEYTPADVKLRGKKTVCKEVGEVAAKRLELPEPIPAETVRGYLRTKKTGDG
jgi:hypothetical protein